MDPPCWNIKIENLEAAITPRTKAIVINRCSKKVVSVNHGCIVGWNENNNYYGQPPQPNRKSFQHPGAFTYCNALLQIQFIGYYWWGKDPEVWIFFVSIHLVLYIHRWKIQISMFSQTLVFQCSGNVKKLCSRILVIWLLNLSSTKVCSHAGGWMYYYMVFTSEWTLIPWGHTHSIPRKYSVTILYIYIYLPIYLPIL